MDNAGVAVPKEPRLGLVSSNGLFWKSDQAEWEAAEGFHREPRMLGRRGHDSSRRVADFYHPPGMYILYGNHGAVYVGITGSTQGLGKRIRDHLSDRLADKWDKFSWFGYGSLETSRDRIEVPSKLPLQPIPHKWAIRDFEASVIRALDVPSNSKNSGFRAGDVVWEQVRRADAEPLLKRHAGL